MVTKYDKIISRLMEDDILMLERLADIEKRYIDLSDKINDPEVISNNEEWRKLMKEHSDISPIVEKYREYKETEEAVEEAREMLDDSDEEMKALAKEEFSEGRKKLDELKDELTVLLLPKDPND